MRFDLFSSGRLYAALQAAGYPDLPSARTVRSWIQHNNPPVSAQRFVAELLETQEEAPRPVWVEGLEARLDAIAASQRVVADEAIDRAIAALAPASSLEQAAALNRRLEELLRLPASESPEQSAAEGPGAVEPQEQRDV